MHELPLVFLTVLAQGAVGIFFCLGLIELFAKPGEKAMTRAFIAALVLLGVASVASVTHLGQPQRMFNVMFGLAHASALSLEIVALSLFGGSATAYTGMRLFNLMPLLRKLTLPVAMISGLVFILAFTNVYTLETVPTWNSGWTFFQFLMSAAVIGPVGALMLLRCKASDAGRVQVVADKALATAGLMTLLVSVTGYTGFLIWLGQLDTHMNPLAVMDYHPMMLMARVALLMTGVIAVAVSALRGQNHSLMTAVICFLMVVVAELMGRIFFYDIYISASAGM